MVDSETPVAPSIDTPCVVCRAPGIELMLGHLGPEQKLNLCGCCTENHRMWIGAINNFGIGMAG